MKPDERPLWWSISQDSRVRLSLLQYKLYKTKLDMIKSKPPWEEPVNIDSETYEYEHEQEIKKEMETPPSNRLNSE